MDKPLNLLAWSSRKLLKEGPVKVNGKRNHMLFLFSDIILVAEKFEKSLKFSRIIELHRAALNQDNDKDFTVSVDGGSGETSLSCHCSGKSDAADWISKINRIIDNYNEHRVYGIPLNQVLAREKEADGIPRVLKQCLFYLAQHAGDVEGIFRVPGDSNIISEYKVLYDCGMSKDVDFSLCSSHDVAGLCKLYLRELPSPLIPHSSFDSVVNIEKSVENESDDSDDHSEHVKKVAELIRDVPKERQKVLRFVLFFLKEFSVNSPQTKMNIENLAMVFSPNLIRPKVDTMDTAMASPMITKFVIFLIKNFEEIWEIANEGVELDEKEEESAHQLLESILQKDNISLDDVMKLKLSSRPSQYIDLAPPSPHHNLEAGNMKSPKKVRYAAKKSPRRESPSNTPESTDKIGRYRKKKKNSGSFKFRKSNTGL